MKKKRLFKYVAYLLLVAVQFAVVPFHQIFHDHKVTDLRGQHTGSLVKKYEKPCCKPFETLFGTKVNAVLQTSIYEYVTTVFSGYISVHISTPFFHFSNKAPPVKIA